LLKLHAYNDHGMKLAAGAGEVAGDTGKRAEPSEVAQVISTPRGRKLWPLHYVVYVHTHGEPYTLGHPLLLCQCGLGPIKQGSAKRVAAQRSRGEGRRVILLRAAGPEGIQPGSPAATDCY